MYRPPHHKNAWRGRARSIPIGPRGQELLGGFVTADPDEYLFSPRRAVAERLDARAAGRKTPRWPSHLARNQTKRKKRPRRSPRERYDTAAYGHAVARACDRAFPPPGDLARRSGETEAAWRARLTPDQFAEVRAWRAEHRWHPNQLRHTFATKVRKRHGLEAAQVLLGHAHADVTQVYAEADEQLAAAVAEKIG